MMIANKIKRNLLSKVCVIVLLTVACFGLVACKAKNYTEDIVGYWTVSSIQFSNKNYMSEDLEYFESLKNYLYETSFKLDADGTGVLTFLREKVNLNWSIKEQDKYGAEIDLQFDDVSIESEEISLLKDKTLYWIYEDLTGDDVSKEQSMIYITFERTEETEQVNRTTMEEQVDTPNLDNGSNLTIDTEYYQISLPEIWKDKYTYTVDGNGLKVTIYEKQEYDLTGYGFLATVEMFPVGTIEEFFSQEYYWDFKQYLGILEKGSERYHLIVELSSDGNYDDATRERIYKMIQDIETGALRNITAKDGVTFTEMTEPSETNINQDSGSSLVEINPLPQINWTANLLGEDYNSYLYQNGIYGIDFDSEFIAEHYYMRVSDSSWDGDILYYGTNNGNYYAVGVNQQDGTIVSCIYEAVDTASYVYENFKESCFYDVEPRIIIGNGTERILLWKCNNGYLIVHAYISGACRNDNDYSNYSTDYYSYVTKKEYNEWTINTGSYVKAQ